MLASVQPTPMFRVLPSVAPFGAVQLGTRFGNASPRRPEAPAAVAMFAAQCSFDEVVLLPVAFTNRVAVDAEAVTWRAGLRRPEATADGFLVSRPGQAVFITNADCAVGILADTTSQRAVVMHLGLGCLWRADEAPLLMARAVEALAVPARQLALWIGFGIGPCCFGYSHDDPQHIARAQDLARRYGSDVMPGRVARGPRRGQYAIDPTLIAVRQAEQLGIGATAVNATCTSCDGLADPDGPGYGRLFSNIRDASGERPRNLVLAGLPLSTSETTATRSA